MKRLSLTLPIVLLAVFLSTPALAGELRGTSRPTLEWGPVYEQVTNETSELSLEERRKIQERLRIRRKMVDVHQVFAFSASGFIVASEVVGIINDVALDIGKPGRGELEGSLAVHRILAGAAITTYLGAGITAWAMPRALRLNQPTVKPKGVDSGVLHVVLSVIHGISMATVIATGFLQANIVPAGRGWDAVIISHKIAGFTASGVLIAAGITIGTL